MSWNIQASGIKQKALDFCLKDKYFNEYAPPNVIRALEELCCHFTDESAISISSNGHINGGGGSIEIKIQSIPNWIK